MRIKLINQGQINATKLFNSLNIKLKIHKNGTGMKMVQAMHNTVFVTITIIGSLNVYHVIELEH